MYATLSRLGILDAKMPILDAQMPVFHTKMPILDAQNARLGKGSLYVLELHNQENTTLQSKHWSVSQIIYQILL